MASWYSAAWYFRAWYHAAPAVGGGPQGTDFGVSSGPGISYYQGVVHAKVLGVGREAVKNIDHDAP